MREFKSVSQWEHQGKKVFACESDQFPKDLYDPAQIIAEKQNVIIDGKEYKLLGIDRFLRMCSPSFPYNNGFGLKVDEVN